MKPACFGLFSLLFYMGFSYAQITETLQETTEQDFKDLLQLFENETTESNEAWCSDWCAFAGETFVKPDLTAYCRCEGQVNLTKVKVYCKPDEIYDRSLGRCARLEGGGRSRCVLRGQTCPGGQVGIRNYPDERFYRNYIVCLQETVIVASCEIGYYYNNERKKCVKGGQKGTIVARKDCIIAPDVQCEEIGTKAMEEHVKDGKLLEKCGECYYICNERNMTHYDLLIECVNKTFLSSEESSSEEEIILPDSSDHDHHMTFNKDQATISEEHPIVSEIAEVEISDRVLLERQKGAETVVESEAISEASEIVITDEEVSDVTEIIETTVKRSEETITEDAESIELTEDVLTSTESSLESSEVILTDVEHQKDAEAVVPFTETSEGIASAEIAEEKLIETVSETSEIVTTDQEQRDNPEVIETIIEPSEETITEDAESIELAEDVLPSTDSILESSEVILTHDEHQKDAEAVVSFTETSDVIITEEIAQPEVAEEAVVESETISETSEIVITDQKERGVTEVIEPMAEPSEKVITEDAESIELAEDVLPETDSILESSEVILTHDEHQKDAEAVVSFTETSDVIITEEIAQPEVAEEAVVESETISETSEIVITDQKERGVTEVIEPMAEPSEKVIITEDAESIELAEDLLTSTESILESSEDLLPYDEHQKNAVPVVTVSGNSETISETSEIVITDQEERDVTEIKELMTDPSEKVTIEGVKPMELIEDIVPSTGRILESSEVILTEDKHQKDAEQVVPVTEKSSDVIITEEIAPPEIAKETVVESDTISETVITDQKKHDVTEIIEPMREPSEEAITDDAESIELAANMPASTDSILEPSEVILSNNKHQKDAEAVVTVTETSDVIITEEMAQPEIAKESVVKSETISETSEIVITDQEERDITEVIEPITEPSEKAITEEAESIELAEDVLPSTDSILESSEIILTHDEHQKDADPVVPVTETSEVIITENIAPAKIAEETIVESETFSETSEIVITDEEKQDVTKIIKPMTEELEETITEDAESTELAEDELPETDSILESTEVILTPDEHQKNAEPVVTVTETSEVIITEEIVPAEMTVVNSETFSETSEKVITDQEERDITEILKPITEQSEKMITEKAEPIVLTEDKLLETASVLESSEVILTNDEYQKDAEPVVPGTEKSSDVIITEEITPTEIAEKAVIELETISETSEIVIIDQEERDVTEIIEPMAEQSEEAITVGDAESVELAEDILPSTDRNLESSEIILSDDEHQKDVETVVTVTETADVIITEKITQPEIVKELVVKSETISETSEIVITDQEEREVTEIKESITEQSEETITEEAEPIELADDMLPSTDRSLESSEIILTHDEHQKNAEPVVAVTKRSGVIITEEIASPETAEERVVELETNSETSEIVITDQEERDVTEIFELMAEPSEETITEDAESMELTEDKLLETASVLESSEVILSNDEHQKNAEPVVPVTERSEVIITEESAPAENAEGKVIDLEMNSETSEMVVTDQKERDVTEIIEPMTERSEEAIIEDAESVELTEDVPKSTESSLESLDGILTHSEHQKDAELVVPGTETSEVIITKEIVAPEIAEDTTVKSETISETSEIVITGQEGRNVTEVIETIIEFSEEMITEKAEPIVLPEDKLLKTSSVLESSEVIFTDEHQKDANKAVVTVTERLDMIITKEIATTEMAEKTVVEPETISETSETVITDQEEREVTEVIESITKPSEEAITEKAESIELAKDIVPSTDRIIEFTEVTLTHDEHQKNAEPIVSVTETSEVVIITEKIALKSSEIAEETVVESEIISETSEKLAVITNDEHQKIAEILGSETTETSTSEKHKPTINAIEETSEIIVHFPYNNSSTGNRSKSTPSQTESCKLYKFRPCEQTGFFRYRNSCTRHYQCFYSKTCGLILPSRIYDCPSCLKFNQNLQACDLPEKIPECSIHQETYKYLKGHRLTEPIKNCTGPGKYPDPTHPSRYYECLDIFNDQIYRLTVKICPLGGKFDPSKGGCISKKGKIRPIRPENHDIMTPKCMSSNYAYDRYDCHKFYLCKNGLPKVNLMCPNDYVFNGYNCQHKGESVLCNWDSLKKLLYKIQ